MTAKITYEIPESNCEKIANALFNVINDDINEQFIITSNPVFDAYVYEERFTPFSNETDKDVLITIHMSSTETVSTNQEFARMKGSFYVRSSVRYKEAESEEGSEISQKAAKKLANAIRYIIESKENFILHESIQTKSVSSVEMSNPFREDTTQNETASQVMLEIEYNEPVNDIPVNDIAGIDLTTENKFKIVQNY